VRRMGSVRHARPRMKAAPRTDEMSGRSRSTDRNPEGCGGNEPFEANLRRRFHIRSIDASAPKA
jgi:hypothetical protein